MKYQIRLSIEVDDEAPWLEIGETENLETIEELMRDFIYDVDDVTLGDIHVKTENK